MYRFSFLSSITKLNKAVFSKFKYNKLLLSLILAVIYSKSNGFIVEVSSLDMGYSGSRAKHFEP
ncbi:hypothetical protein LIQ79_15165, partial [Erysipelatoclostridium ramosum]|nr:hypothetical protein [Thomasclavelia ramosa]